MLVMNNVRCILLSRVFAVINRETPFVNLQKFAAYFLYFYLDFIIEYAAGAMMGLTLRTLKCQF